MSARAEREERASAFFARWRELGTGGEMRRAESMRAHTTIAIGGPADLFYLPGTTRQVARVVTLAVEIGIPWRVIGRGSNLLVRDGGLPGLTIKLAENFQGSRFGDHWVYSRAGSTFANVGKKCVRRGWSGLEFSVGIPGSVGGAVRMNAGAYGCETEGIVEKVRYLDRDGGLRVARRSEMYFAYRSSSFEEGETVLAALFRLRPGPADEEILVRARRRAEVQPIAERSFGSTYQNPPGDSAWRLIEAAGFKGFQRGGVEVSMRHSNFMINRTGTATARDVEALLERIETEVLRRFDVRLRREVRILGVTEDDT